MQQFQPLRAQFNVQIAHTREIASGPVEARDQAKFNRVVPGEKHDGDRRSRRLGNQRRWTIRGYYSDWPTNQLGHQRRQAIIVTLRPSVFDGHVAIHDVAGFAQALTERADTGRP